MEKVVSDNPLDYAKFILYHRPGNHVCDDLVGQVGECTDVLLQNVDNINPGSRPAWLDGIPTAVSLPDYAVHRGAAAIAVLKEHARSSLAAGPPAAVGGFPLDMDGEPDKYTDAAPEKQSMSLEDMMRRRGN